MEEKTPLDNLTEKTFRLLGALQDLDERDTDEQKQESYNKFGLALMEQHKCMMPFLQPK